MVTILHVEDNLDDAEILTRELRHQGFEFACRRVDTESAFLEALQDMPDLILADYRLPKFNALRALELRREHAPDVPFIVISGTIGEELAVEVMRNGATDYLLKNSLGRLRFAIEHALQQKTLVTEVQRSERALIESEERYRRLVESSPVAIFVHIDFRIVYANPAAARLVGFQKVNDLIGRNTLDFIGPGFHNFIRDRMKDMRARDEALPTLQEKWFRVDGESILVDVTAVPTTYGGQPATYLFAHDVTERVRAEAENQLLLDLSRSIHEAPGIETALAETLTELSQHAGWAYAEAWVPLPDRTALKCSSEAYYLDPSNEEFQAYRETSHAFVFGPGDGMVGKAWSSGKTQSICDMRDEDFLRAEEAQRAGFQSAVFVPVKNGNEVATVLAFYSTEPCERNERFFPLIRTAATQLGAALQRKQAEAEIEQRNEELTLLNSVIGAAASSLNIGDVLKVACNALTTALSAYSATAILFNTGYGKATIMAHQGTPGAANALTVGDVYPLDTNFVANFIQRGAPVAISNVELDTTLPLDIQRIALQLGLASVLALPLAVRDNVVGAVILANTTTRTFAPREIELGQNVAAAISQALHNAQLYQELANYSDVLEQAVEQRTEELRRSTGHIEAILHSIGEGVLVIGPDGRIQTANQAFLRHTGYAHEELETRHFNEFLAKPMTREELAELESNLQDGGIRHAEHVVLRADGSTYDADVTSARIAGKDSNSASYVVSIRDISQRKELERMKDAFVSNVSHELRTPITGLKLLHGLLPSASDERRSQVMDMLRRETDRLERIIEDLLALSRLDQRRVEFNFRATDLNALTSQYVADRISLAEAKGLMLASTETEDLPLVRGDESLLGRVLSIFLTNAMNYTPSGGHITVSTCANKSGGQVWAGFSVKDTGPGISSEEQKQLFQRFVRGTAGHTSGAGGTGLGLAIAKEIVEQHDGRIEVFSEGIAGKGAIFTVWLPLAAESS